jgi:hypothetical protein
MLLTDDSDVVAKRQANAIGNIALRACPSYDPSDKNKDPWEVLGLAQFPQQWANSDKLELTASYSIHFFHRDPERYLDQFIPAQIEVTQSSSCKRFWPGASAAIVAMRAAQSKQRAAAASASSGAKPVLGVDVEFIPLQDDYGGGFAPVGCPGDDGGDGDGNVDGWDIKLFDELAYVMPPPEDPPELFLPEVLQTIPPTIFYSCSKNLTFPSHHLLVH